ncbi:MAG: hypothetical protein EOO13_17505 [Chitinophagaceae bacterium]|nr:MAG: hypothetical protein EOO13_17505 [Chitinophagaceae bacterium]
MKTRAITAFFFTIVMIGSIFLGTYVFTFFYLALSIITLLEFYKLVKASGIRPHRNVGTFAAALIFLLSAGLHYLHFEAKYLLLAVPLVFSIFVIELYKKEKIPFANISYTFIGFIYITAPFCFFHQTVDDEEFYSVAFSAGPGCRAAPGAPIEGYRRGATARRRAAAHCLLRPGGHARPNHYARGAQRAAKPGAAQNRAAERLYLLV